MGRKQIKLSNNTKLDVLLALEPEGDIYPLSNSEFVLIDLEGDDNPLIDLEICEEEGRMIIKIWPEKGEYEVKTAFNE